MNKPLKVFITYVHKNRKAKDKLIECLIGMQREGLISIWHDNEILPGDKWREEVFSTPLPDSDILLHLVSAASLDSENCNKELAEALNFEIRVIPIVLESCDWQNHQLSDLQALPDGGLSINQWDHEDEGWQNVVDGIRKVVDKMQSQTDSASGAPENELRAEFAFQQGNVFMMLEQTDEAIERYSYTIKLDPNCAESYSNRGLAYTNKGDYGRAIEDLNTAIDLNPDYAKAYYYRGLVYGGKGDFDRAIEDYTQAIELKPDYAIVYYCRGGVGLHLREWEQAKSDLMTARNMGINIIAAFRNDYGSVEGFEQITGVQLPADIAAMLTPQILAMRKEEGGDATHESVSDAEIDLDEIIRNYDRAWKTLAKP